MTDDGSTSFPFCRHRFIASPSFHDCFKDNRGFQTSVIREEDVALMGRPISVKWNVNIKTPRLKSLKKHSRARVLLTNLVPLGDWLWAISINFKMLPCIYMKGLVRPSVGNAFVKISENGLLRIRNDLDCRMRRQEGSMKNEKNAWGRIVDHLGLG